jgi:bifunctional DNA-binding transcriptional regulator/antitoxin component of YhaV-PrlF toxin-antitoxin module
MNAVTLSSKCQISILKHGREYVGWKPGQTFAVIPRGKGYELVPVPKLEDIIGIAKGVDPTSYRDRYGRYPRRLTLSKIQTSHHRRHFLRKAHPNDAPPLMRDAHFKGLPGLECY